MFNLFSRPDRKTRDTALALYKQALAATRQPEFYTTGGVPDTFDGRFDLLMLLTHPMFRVLAREGRLTQSLYDTMFLNLEQSLRQMGAGDLGVPKHMRRMMKAYNGRMDAYESARLGERKWEEALIRNLFGTTPEADPAPMAAYAARLNEAADNVTADDMREGRFEYPSFLPERTSNAA